MQNSECNILGVRVIDVTATQARDIIIQAARTHQGLKLAFCNAHFANVARTDAVFREALDDFLILPDGIGVDLASRLLRGTPFRANLNGTDFTPSLFEHAEGTFRVGLLGGRPGVAEKAAHIFAERFPAHNFSVLGHGYLSEDDKGRVLNALLDDPVDILLVAMGNPLQEKWIANNITSDHAGVAMGIGALLDFTAGEVKRAPEWVRRTRTEWLYRLKQEPGRLWRRYVIGNASFLAFVLYQRLFGPSGLQTQNRSNLSPAE